MSGVIINRFAGEIPRNNPRTLNMNVPELAIDVCLDEGTLRPWQERLFVEDKGVELNSIFRVPLPNCCWLASTKCVDWALVQPSCNYIVRTGERDYPEIATFEDACNDNWCRLGPPCPDQAPVAQNLDGQTYYSEKRIEQTAYRIAYVNRYGFEGPGGPPSAGFDTNDGQSKIVQIPPCPSPEWCVTKIRLYRAATAFESGSEASNPQNTEWFLVAELDCGVSSYVDSTRAIDLSAAGAAPAIFLGEERLPPPANLRNVVSMEDGTLTAISGEYIVRSEVMHPGSWPLKYYKKLWQDDRPVRIAAWKRTLYVATTGHPYTFETVPDCNSDGREGWFRHPEPSPIVAPRSMAVGSNACFFASVDGLVAISGGQQRVVGEELWSKDQWRDLHPEQMIGAILDGHYFGFTDVVGFRMRTAAPEHFDATSATLTRLSDRPRAMHVTGFGELFMAIDTRIEKWNAGTTYRNYLWRSSKQLWARRTSLRAAYLLFGEKPIGNVRCKLICERGEYEKSVLNENLWSVPNWFSSADLQIQVNGVREVLEVAVGSTYKEAYRAGATV